MAPQRMMRPTPEGVAMEVQVIPRARKAGLDGVRAGALLVRLHAAPVDGAANKELTEVIANAFGVSRAAVTIVSGELSRRKRVHVAGLSVVEADLMVHNLSARARA